MPKTSDHYTYGFHAVEALLKQNPQDVQQLFLLQGRQDKRLQQLQHLAEEKGLKIEWVNREQLDELASGNHQGVVAAVQSRAMQTRIETYDEPYLKSRITQLQQEQVTPFLLLLDGVTDPHNLGACLRSAEAAGIHIVVVPKDNAASLNPTVIKVASGAAEVVPLVRVTNLVRTLQWLQKQGIWVMGAAGEAEQAHYAADLTGPLALVMGSEGKGLRRLTREACDHLIRIPMLGTVSSLNVSVATGICLFEALRQRQ